VQDLVGVGVAHAAEEPRIGQRPLERVVLAAEDVGERGGRRLQDLEPRRLHAPRHAQGRPLLRPGLAHRERPAVELEDRLRAALGRLPMQPPGDHEVQLEEEVVGELEDDPLADAADVARPLSFDGLQGRVDRPKQEGAAHDDAAQGAVENPLAQGLDVHFDVRQLRHRQS
jgi:hypothetical protein